MSNFFGDSSGTSYGGGGASGGLFSDLTGALDHANNHSGSSGNQGMFQEALSFVQNQPPSGNVDENNAVQQHQNLYGGGGPSGPVDHGSIGSAAAMQALKMFNGGSSGSGNVQNQFVGMAMGEAAKLWENQNANGNVASGTSQQSAVNSAAQMALSMYMKSQMGGGGGAGGLMSMASKFM